MTNRFAEFLPHKKSYLSLPPEPLNPNSAVYHEYLQKTEGIMEKNFAIYQNNAAVSLTYKGKDNLRFRQVLAQEQEKLRQAESHYFVISNGHFYQTKYQRQIDQFNLLLPYLQKLTFTLQSPMFSKSYLFVLRDNKVIKLVKNSAQDYQQIDVYDKEQFLLDLAQLQIGGWQTNYELPKGIMVYDGAKWHLSLAFRKGSNVWQREFKGYMAWPYNFADLQRALKIFN